MNILERLIGQTVDEKYRFEQKLGQGGMGAVYKATHLGTSRPVAVKVISPQLMSNTEFVERFRREAEAAGKLRHPNVVDVTDFGFTNFENQRLAYLVMEFLDGCPLSDVLKEETELPLSWVVDIFEQVCLAVDRAHKQGIIHRDLKPENIWLEPNERGGYTVKVLDFGLAKLGDKSKPSLPEQQPVNTSTVDLPLNDSDEVATAVQLPKNSSHSDLFAENETKVQQAANTAKQESVNTEVLEGGLTRVGTILGTPLYMSPEQCEGKSLDIRSDIYSLGVIAYQLLADKLPFNGSAMSLIAQHISTPAPNLGDERSDISKDVVALVMSALEKEPSKRPSSAAAFANALRARSEGAGTIFRQAFTLYSEHFSTFIKIAFIAFIPALMGTFLSLLQVISMKLLPNPKITIFLIALGSIFGIFGLMAAQAVNSGVTVPLVAQLLLTPLKPVNVHSAFRALRKELRNFLPTAFILSFVTIIFIFATQTLFWTLVRLISNNRLPTSLSFYTFTITVLTIAFLSTLFLKNSYVYAPVIFLEKLKGIAALKRSYKLTKRVSKLTLQIFLPQQLLFTIYPLIFSIAFREANMTPSLFRAVLIILFTSVVVRAIEIVLNPLLVICLALLYYRSRQVDGETLREILSSYEPEAQISNWQQNMREQIRQKSMSSQSSKVSGTVQKKSIG